MADPNQESERLIRTILTTIMEKNTFKREHRDLDKLIRDLKQRQRAADQQLSDINPSYLHDFISHHTKEPFKMLKPDFIRFFNQTRDVIETPPLSRAERRQAEKRQEEKEMEGISPSAVSRRNYTPEQFAEMEREEEPNSCVASGFRNLKTRGKRMRGGSVGETAYNMFNKMNRQMVKNVMVPGMDFVAGLIPAVMGQPELTPLAVGAAHAIGTAAQQPLLELLRSDKRQGKLDQQATQQREQEEEDALIKKYKISGKGIMNQPRSRSVGSDMLSPMAAATMGHSQAMNMKLKLEKDMAMGRRKQVGLVGVSGNLLGPGASPALQSQPQQNFQFRHTISSPVYHPHVYGNGLYA